MESELNKDLILREQLAIQRTLMANQTTLLSFMRTSLYFAIAGLSIRGLLTMDGATFIEFTFYVLASGTFVFGWINFFVQQKRIKRSRIHIGNYKMEYFHEHTRL
jgi:putative membrane protein